MVAERTRRYARQTRSVRGRTRANWWGHFGVKILTMNRLLAAAALLSLVSVPAFAQRTTPEPDVVVTMGEGVVQAVPDRAWITISAESRAQSAREAQRKNTEAMTPVQDKLRAAGIAADAIKTVGYDVQYEWDYVNNRRVGRGYVARNTIEVRVDAIDRVGEFLEIAGAAGATAVGGIRFDLKERAKLQREALRMAVAEARTKAEAAAAGAGRAIDRIMRVDEHGTVVPVPVPRALMRDQGQIAAAEAAPPISAGQIELRANVTLTAALK